MKTPHPLMILFWIAMVALPLALCAVAIGQLPTGIDVPLHFDASGTPDRYGSASELWPLGFIMAGCNALLAVMYLFSDALYNHGLVHGISCRSTRPFLAGTAVFMNVVCAACFAFVVYTVLGAV